MEPSLYLEVWGVRPGRKEGGREGGRKGGAAVLLLSCGRVLCPSFSRYLHDMISELTDWLTSWLASWLALSLSLSLL